jgi:hypothetical protein
MGGGFCESPFMSLSTITVNGEEFLYDFVIDQLLPVNFDIAQSYDLDLSILQDFTFKYHVGITSNFDFNIDELKNSDFLR